MQEIYKNNPPVWLRRVLQFPEWPRFDGDPMTPYFVDIYDYPANAKIEELFQQERKRLKRDLGKVYLKYNRQYYDEDLLGHCKLVKDQE